MSVRRLIAGLLAAALAFASAQAVAQDHIRLPDLGGSAQAILTPAQANQYGASMLHQMRALHMVLDDPLVHDYLNEVGYRLVAHSDDPSQKFTFFVVNAPVVNAFASPGGYIGVYAGLIDLTQSESELAAVMAHEIGHITQHHLERALEAEKKDTPLQILAMLGAIASMAGNSHSGYTYGYNGYNDSSADTGIGIMATAQAIAAQRQINFTRKDEVEADRTGMRTLVRAGYNPEAMAEFFQRMEDTLGNGPNVPPLLLDHPVTPARIADAKARARMLVAGHKNFRVPPISRMQWEKITAPLAFVNQPGELSAQPTHATSDLSLYRLMRARVRVLSHSANDAVRYFHSHFGHSGFDTPAHHYGYALALTRDHQAAAAIAQLQPLARKYPSSLPVSLALADALDRDGKGAQSIKLYRNLVANSPNNRAVILGYAQVLIRDKSAAHARTAADLIRPLLTKTDEPQLFETYARASEIAGNKVDAAEGWANASYLSGRPFDAMQQLKRALARKDINYYQRARLEADVEQLQPVLLELRKKHIQTADRPNGQAG